MTFKTRIDRSSSIGRERNQMGQRNMSSIVVMAAAVVLVGCLMNVSEGLNLEPKVFHVGGKVLCQDCSSDWNKWLHGEPIKGAKVSVTCLDERSRVVHYCSDLTDELGEYEMIVDKYIGGKELNPRLCSARLVSSPDQACNVLTNFGNGRTGVKLSRPSFVYRDLIKFVIEPFYFTSPMCEEPDTSDESETADPSPYTSNDEEKLYGDKGNNY